MLFGIADSSIYHSNSIIIFVFSLLSFHSSFNFCTYINHFNLCSFGKLETSVLIFSNLNLIESETHSNIIVFTSIASST